jgi:hypothetical protein
MAREPRHHPHQVRLERHSSHVVALQTCDSPCSTAAYPSPQLFEKQVHDACAALLVMDSGSLTRGIEPNSNAGPCTRRNRSRSAYVAAAWKPAGVLRRSLFPRILESRMSVWGFSITQSRKCTRIAHGLECKRSDYCIDGVCARNGYPLWFCSMHR